jgi:hypothetical protein
VVNGSNAKKGSHLLDRPVLTPRTAGVAGTTPVADPDLAWVFGNKKTTATLLSLIGIPGAMGVVNGIPAQNIDYL